MFKRWIPLRTRTTLQRRMFTSDAPVVVPKSERDREFLTALQVFYRLEGHFTVPFDYVVPSFASDNNMATSLWPQETWGLDLGNRLRLFTRGRCSPYKCALLQTIGFPFNDWKSYVWEMQIIPSLRVFQEQEGHLFVRQSFQVPVGDTKWPRAAWGVKLGSQCQLLRRDADDGLTAQRKQELDAMGFIWSDAQWKWKMQFLKAMKHYRQLYGHSEVHHSFRVPLSDPEWPSGSWGYRLGQNVAKIKASLEEQNITPRAMADLRQVGFFHERQSLQVWQQTLLPSFTLYPQVYHQACIPRDFIVPSETPWPESAWGMRLGYIVATINSHRMFYTEMQHDKPHLQALGYTWEVLFGKWAKEFVPALRYYKAQYGHCDVPSWYVVPSSDTLWPTDLRGYALGKHVVHVRRKGRTHSDVADVVTDLDTLGFHFHAFESYYVDRVLPALEVYARLYSDLHVPPGFIVPCNQSWPQPSWGIKLGHTVRHLQTGHQYINQVEKYRPRLEALGFVGHFNHSTATVQREIVTPSVRVFHSVNGSNTPVPRDFIVPSTDARYPSVAQNFELGAWLEHRRTRTGLTCPRVQGSKKALKPRIAQALSPHADEYWNDIVLASFRAYARAEGSCDNMDGSFRVPEAPEYPFAAWGLNLGLRLRHIRHGVRYARERAKYKDELVQLGVLRDGDSVLVDDERQV